MDAYDELEMAEAVAAGAEFMDAIDAGVTDDAERWFWVVDPETLRMDGRGCGCVLMQHSPSGVFYPWEYNLPTTVNFGFHAGYTSPLEERRRYAALTALWVEEIIDRRAAWFDAHPEAVLSEAV